MEFFIELLLKTIVIFGIVNYAFIAFNNNIFTHLISSKMLLKIIYLLIASCGVFMFYEKVLPDWIKAFNFFAK